MKRLIVGITAVGILGSAASLANAQDLDHLIQAARQEGTVNSVGMPDDWANWKGIWEQIARQYGLKHQDTDMSSAQEIAKFEAEKHKASADIGDVGHAFGPIAVQKGVTQPYKPSTWNQIPDWAKDKEGHWALAYTGTIAFIINTTLVKHPPASWADLLKGRYKVAIGDVGVAAQANSSVLAAALARGGDEKNLQPGLEFFAELARQKRLSLIDPNLAHLEKGEVEVGVLWDFNALGFRDKIDPTRFVVVIPSDGSVVSGYTTLINKYAQHPNAAKLAREFIFSDAGQIHLAGGYARPIRASVKLPPEVQAKLLPPAQYQAARPIRDFAAWEASTRQLPRQWQEQVMVHVQ